MPEASQLHHSLAPLPNLSVLICTVGTATKTKVGYLIFSESKVS